MKTTINNKKKNFKLEKRKYRALDIIFLAYKIAPMQVGLLMFLTIIDGLASTSLMALVTAGFVDRALDIFHGARIYSEIYRPLGFLIILTAFMSMTGSLYMLVGARIKLLLEDQLLPLVIEVQAKLKYAYMEDSACQEMLEITADEMEETFLDGLEAYIAIIRSVFALGSLILLLITQMWLSALIICFCSLPLVLVALWAGKKNYWAKVDARKYERRYSYFSDEMLCIREAALERSLFAYAEKMTDSYYENFLKASNIQLGVLFKTRLATKATSIGLLVISMLTALTLIEPLLLGSLSPGMFTGLVAALIGVGKGLGSQFQDAIKSIAEAKEYMEGLTKLMEMDSVAGATDLPEKDPMDFEKIVFNNVSFSYPNSDRLILDDLSFVLEKGKHYAFVGSNGAGKTTITKLLTGLYDDYEGEILIDGRDIRSLPQAKLKSLFSVIYQDFSHYQISIKDNLLLGNTGYELTENDLNLALEKVGLKEMVDQKPRGIESKLGKIHPHGLDLSGGQWQKLALARSILSQGSIKILDEPTAALDPISENQLYHQFQDLMAGKTAIFISHRLGSTKLADQILVLDGGKVVQRGSHQQLINEGGLYAEMYREQSRWYSI